MVAAALVRPKLRAQNPAFAISLYVKNVYVKMSGRPLAARYRVSRALFLKVWIYR